MTRYERDQLIEVLHRVEIGDKSLALHILRDLIRAADDEFAKENAVNTALEQQQGAANDQSKRPV